MIPSFLERAPNMIMSRFRMAEAQHLDVDLIKDLTRLVRCHPSSPHRLFDQ